MRDVILLLAVVCALPICVFRPWIGILLWCWIGYMNPHRLTFGFAYDFQFAQLVGATTLVGFIFGGGRKPFIWNRETGLIVLLWVWFTFTTVFAMYPDDAWIKWQEVTKILLMAMLTVWLFQDRQKLRILVMVIALSLGFYGLKGGLFVLATGGHWMVLGPPESFFATNTELALVLNMSLPMSLYLAREEPRRWLRMVLWATFGLSALAVPFTYSRGGFVGLLIVLAVLFLKARHRLVMIPVAVAVIVAFVALAPEHWFDRIETLETYQEDESANLRFMSWRVSYEIAADRPLGGGGFNVFRHRETYDIYMPEYPRTFGHDAHSIYFNFLGEHGWIGLGLFLLLVLSCFHSLRQLRRLGKTNEDFRWVANYAHMIQASLIAYLVTGAFLSVAYFDLSYQLYIMVGLLKGLVSQQMATAAEGAAAPAAIEPSPAVATRPLPRPRVS